MYHKSVPPLQSWFVIRVSGEWTLTLSQEMALPEPFGGLLLLLAITASFFVGIVVAVIGRRSRKQVCIGIGIIAAPWILLLLLAILSPGIDEWNRDLKTPSEAWGTWEGDGYQIELNPDRSFTSKRGGESLSGTYRVEDWNVFLTEDSGTESYMRFVEDSGELLLLSDSPRDESPRPGPITRKR